MFVWTRKRRREKLLESSVQFDELSRLDASLWQASQLSVDQRERLARWIRVFIAEKRWEGCNGFEISDEVKRTIAASAGLMVLAYPDWYFDRTKTLLIYPRPYVAKSPTNIQAEGVVGEYARSGETVYRGPIILNWRDIVRESHRPFEGRHLIIHEFAHQLDMINGPWADGFPPLPNHVDEKIWQEALRAEYQAAVDVVEQGESVLIDDYGLTSLSEFFAVGSELYFQTPDELAEFHPGFFALLDSFYQVDLRA
jgi:Mlc titration factor MtfA (ptsG expression regulator)